MIRWTHPRTPIVAILNHHKSHYYQPLTCHQEHEINLAIRGEGTYRLGEGRGQTTRLSAGEILLMPAGTNHEIDVDDHLDLAALHVHPKALDGMKAPRGKPARLLAKMRTWDDPPPWRKVTAPDMYATLRRFTEEVVAEQNRRDPGREPLLRAMAVQTAVHFLRLMLLHDSPQASGDGARRILTVQNWIDRHFAEPCDIASMAKMAHLAPTYFAARFREVVGQPPMAYVRERRMEQARLLLQQTGQPIKVIAWSVGFADITHFNHAFRQATGLTPSVYRKAKQPIT